MSNMSQFSASTQGFGESDTDFDIDYRYDDEGICYDDIFYGDFNFTDDVFDMDENTWEGY